MTVAWGVRRGSHSSRPGVEELLEVQAGLWGQACGDCRYLSKTGPVIMLLIIAWVPLYTSPFQEQPFRPIPM